ncbi:MAG: delta(1)-pyrroline-2-carboxylate reductase family protein, partial [Tepidimonas sp.]
VTALPTLADVVLDTPAWRRARRADGPVLFKSCGWAGWDLAAARCALASAAG